MRRDRPAPEKLRERLSSEDTACPRCGYNLCNLVDVRCPECGFVLAVELLRGSPTRTRRDRVVFSTLTTVAGVAFIVGLTVVALQFTPALGLTASPSPSLDRLLPAGSTILIWIVWTMRRSLFDPSSPRRGAIVDVAAVVVAGLLLLLAIF